MVMPGDHVGVLLPRVPMPLDDDDKDDAGNDDEDDDAKGAPDTQGNDEDMSRSGQSPMATRLTI